MPVSVNSERKGVSLVWDETSNEMVTVYAEGEEGDVHNKNPQMNNGEAGVFFPVGFSGACHIEVRAADGSVVSEGDVTIS